MRFLFVYQDYAEPARRLLDELSVRDVQIIIARKNATTPTPEELELLQAHTGAEAAGCQINRKYRKCAAAYVTFCCEPKKFRPDDQPLREWLAPPTRTPATYDKPTVAFRTAADDAARLILHPDALATADEMAEHRWEFANLAAGLLARYAKGEQLGPARDWKSIYGVEFAVNGQIAFKYKIRHGAGSREVVSEWHLKEGDRTSRESAARVYFTRVEIAETVWVVVSYVGPHPEDGKYQVKVELA